MQIKDNIAPLIEDTKRDILEDIAETEADDSFGTFRFFFTSPIDESYRFFEQQKLGLEYEPADENPAMTNALHVFEEAGCTIDYGDTVNFSFSLNRCWYSARCNRCIRSFGYTLPVIADIDALARLEDDVAKGRILMVVRQED